MVRPTVRTRKVYRSYFEAFFIAIAIGALIRIFVLTPYKIPSTAMAPTLLSGDYVFVYKLPFGLQIPWGPKIGKIQQVRVGDVLLFSYPKSPKSLFIKRVLAVGGDKVEIKERGIFVNDVLVEGHPLDSMLVSDFKSKENFEFYTESLTNKTYVVSYTKNVTHQNFGPIFIPQGEVFMLGDNRDGSDDSRYWGTIPQEQLLGRIAFVWFSYDLDQMSFRWGRFFKSID